MQDPLLQSPAPCPVHPGNPARGVCARCGTFVCDVCTEQGQRAECLACRQREGLGFRFTRDAWTVSTLGSHAWATFKRNWVALVLAGLVLGVVMMLLGAGVGFGQIALLGTASAQTPFALKNVLLSSGLGLVLNLLVTPMLVGYIELCLTALRGRPASVALLFAPYARFVTVATVLVIYSAVGFVYNLTLSFFFGSHTMPQFYAAVWIWWLLAAPLLLYVGTGIGFTYAVIADDPKVGALEAIARSWRIASGKRWSILLVWVVSTFAMMVGFIMCLLPSLVAIPWVSLLWSGCYLALATPTPARGQVQ